MALVLKVAAAVIAVAGLATLWRGADPSLLTYGYTLMTVGAVIAGAGIILFGLGEVVGRIEALRAVLAGEASQPPIGQAVTLEEPPVEAAGPAPAPVPPTRESLGLRPLGAGAAAAVAATGLAASAAAAPVASAPVPDEPAKPEPLAEPEPSIDALLADIRDAAGDTPAQPVEPVLAAEEPAAVPHVPSPPADEPPLLVAEAVPVIGEAKSDPAQAEPAEPAEPDPLASLSQALEDLTDEIARGGRAEPLPASEPVPVPPLPAAEPVAAPPEPAPVIPERDPEQELADLIAAESGAIRGDRHPVAAGGEEPAAEPVRPAEPDSFLARLRRSMGGGERKEVQTPREEPVLPALGADPAMETRAAETQAAAATAIDSSEPVGEPDAEPAERPTFSIEAEMERALMAALDAKPEAAPAVDQAAPPAAPAVPPPVAPPVVAPAAAPEPAAPAAAEPRGPSVRDPAMATLARDFPELGDLLAPRKPSPADPADALIADLKGIFDSSETAPAPTEPVSQPAAPPPRRPVAPLLREGVIAQIPFRLYGDGTIEADLPEGTTHFGSLREFRAHVGG